MALINEKLLSIVMVGLNWQPDKIENCLGNIPLGVSMRPFLEKKKRDSTYRLSIYKMIRGDLPNLAFASSS